MKKVNNILDIADNDSWPCNDFIIDGQHTQIKDGWHIMVEQRIRLNICISLMTDGDKTFDAQFLHHMP